MKNLSPPGKSSDKAVKKCHRSMAYRDEWLHFNAKWHFNQAGHLVAANALHEFLTSGPADFIPQTAGAARGD